MLPCGCPQRGGGTRVGAPPPGKLRNFPRYMRGFLIATCSPYVGTFLLRFSRFGGIIHRLEVFLLPFFPWWAFLLRFSPCEGHFIFIFHVGGEGGFFVLMEAPPPPPPLRKLLRALACYINIFLRDLIVFSIIRHIQYDINR